MARPRPIWTADRLEQAQALRREGLPWREVAARLGLDWQRLYHAVRYHGLPLRPCRPFAETVEAARDLLDVLGLASSARLADSLGITVATANKALQALRRGGEAELISTPLEGVGRVQRWRLREEVTR